MTPGENCPDSNNPVYDLGAVWVDMDTNYIAWQIYSPDMTDAVFCAGGTKGANPGGFAVAIEFDSDNNKSTGCNMSNNEPCYPGAEYQIWVYGDNSTKFKKYNGSLSTCNPTDQECFYTLTEELYNILLNWTCATPTILIK